MPLPIILSPAEAAPGIAAVTSQMTLVEPDVMRKFFRGSAAVRSWNTAAHLP